MDEMDNNLMEVDGVGGEELDYEMYVVEAILDKSANGKQYLVKWEGWDDPTWEPVENHVSALPIPSCPHS